MRMFGLVCLTVSSTGLIAVPSAVRVLFEPSWGKGMVSLSGSTRHGLDAGPRRVETSMKKKLSGSSSRTVSSESVGVLNQVYGEILCPPCDWIGLRRSKGYVGTVQYVRRSDSRAENAKCKCRHEQESISRSRVNQQRARLDWTNNEHHQTGPKTSPE